MKTSEALILIVTVAGLALFCAQGLLEAWSALVLLGLVAMALLWHSQDTDVYKRQAKYLASTSPADR